MINIEFLCCPQCHKSLELGDKQLSCKNCHQKYEVIDSIPILIDKKSLSEHQLSQIKYFEKESFNRITNEISEWQKKYYTRFNENFHCEKDSLAIDCGTGSGYMAIELAKSGAKVIATDLTLENLIQLKKKCHSLGLLERVSFVCCAAEKLPFKTNGCDFFIINAVLEHLVEEQNAIKEINRVSKKNSGLMLTVPLNYKYINPLLFPANYIHDKRIGHLRRYDERIITQKFGDWKLLNVYYTGHFMKVIKVMINMISKLFSDYSIEEEDKKLEHKKNGATNIIAFLKKQKKYDTKQ